MTSFNPYLNFNGNTEEAFNFYQSVFGGKIDMIMRFKDTPDGERVPDHEKDKVMHMSMTLGNGTTLMGTDALESMGHKLTIGNNFHLSVSTETKEEADRLFNGLAAKGKVAVPMQDMFWGDYFGMVTDDFGVQWMVSCSNQKK